MVTKRRSMDGLVDEVPDLRADTVVAIPEFVLVLSDPAYSRTVRRSHGCSKSAVILRVFFVSAVTDAEVTDVRSDDEDDDEPETAAKED